LAVDLRGHGESEGKTNRLGWQGTRDVGACVAFLEGQPEVQVIGGLGISMGGEVLLGAASDYPEIQAIAADGATKRCTAELLALETERPLVRSFTARVMYAAVRLFSGETPPKPLMDSMVEAGTTRYLFIAAGQNEMETAFNELFSSTLNERATLWIAPDASHTGAIFVYPEEYEQQLNSFFDAELLGGER
jgi:pimeloyl-ACP methyl ester carboxylesterase